MVAGESPSRDGHPDRLKITRTSSAALLFQHVRNCHRRYFVTLVIATFRDAPVSRHDLHPFKSYPVSYPWLSTSFDEKDTRGDYEALASEGLSYEELLPGLRKLGHSSPEGIQISNAGGHRSYQRDSFGRIDSKH